MRWGWLILLLVALLAAYAFGLAPGALMKRTADDDFMAGKVAERPRVANPAARPDPGDPPAKPPPGK